MYFECCHSVYDIIFKILLICSSFITWLQRIGCYLFVSLFVQCFFCSQCDTFFFLNDFIVLVYVTHCLSCWLVVFFFPSTHSRFVLSMGFSMWGLWFY